MESERPRATFWRPVFDEVKGTYSFCFRARDTPVQPFRQQMCYELKQLFCHPCAFTQGDRTWREIFAVSSVRCIPAVVLLVVRWLCFLAQMAVVICSLWKGWALLYFFTSWTNILLSVYYLGLSLCSTVAFFLEPPPVNQEITGKNMLLTDPGNSKSLPLLLRLVECVSSIVVGASFVTCVVYWSAIHPTGEEIRDWTSYVEHTCFIPIFIMAFISRIPYRLQHMWISMLYALSYCVLCCIIAFIPLTTWKGRVGYVYNALQYPTHPLEAWLITILFTILLPPITYILFWFVFRFNNPEP